MIASSAKRPDIRRQAEDRFAKVIRRDSEVKAYQKQRRDADVAKIARLRALRLARDAEDAKLSAAPKKIARTRRAKAALPE